MALAALSKIYAASGIASQHYMKIQMTGKFGILPLRGKLSFHARTIQIAGKKEHFRQQAQLAKS